MDHLVFISHSSKDAQIAQLICHRLEDSGIKCWIAPRDITVSDWAASIMDGLARSDVFVIIISESSINSGEVLKEVAQATSTCSYIVPFKVDQADLNQKLDYHLRPCHWLDASTPPIEARIEDLKNRIINLSTEDQVYMNNRKQKLVEHMVWPKSVFLGRDSEVEEIAERLTDDKVLFLQGMGGIGKSEIAKSYAKQYHDRYDTVLFVGYEGNIIESINSDKVTIENLTPWDSQHETAEQFFYRKMDVLRKITSNRTLVILDNYDVDEDSKFIELINSPFHLLVTTRNDHEDYPTMKIGPIEDFNAVREIFLNFCGKKPKEEEMCIINEMLILINCHTITVELLAKQMKASRRKPYDMLAMLKSGGVNTKLKEKVKREGESDCASAFDFISKLFHFSNMNEESKRLLRFMTLVPYTGIDISFFYDVCELDSYDDLNDLIAHSWLMLDEDTDIMSLHPIIADVIRDTLKPTIENCEEYIIGVVREIGNLWFKSGAERERLWPYYDSIIKNYPEVPENMWRTYIELANNAWICGRYALSIELGHKVFHVVQKLYDADSYEYGLAAKMLGGCYHNSGDDVSAEPYYEMGLEAQKAAIHEDSSIDEWRDLATVYQKVARCAYLRGDFEKSKAYLEESVRISELKYDKVPGMGDTYTELCRMYIAMDEYEQALLYCKKSLDHFNAIFGDESPNHAYSYTDFGRCYAKLGRFDEAEEALQKALDINIKYHGIYNLQTFKSKEALADLEMERGNTEKAIYEYTELELEMEQAFGENNQSVIKIRNKKLVVSPNE